MVVAKSKDSTPISDSGVKSLWLAALWSAAAIAVKLLLDGKMTNGEWGGGGAAA